MIAILLRLHGMPGRWLGVAALLAAFISCGGGVGTGGTGSFAAGPITGFGSIIVNGVHFDDSAASVDTDDGSRRDSADLRLGMMVEIDAGTIVNAQAAAEHVRIVSELVGRVDAADLAAGNLTVNGLTVRTNAATVFDGQFAGGLASVGVDSLVEVYGFAYATGAVLATRIEPRTGVTAFKFRGPMVSWDPVARTFQIGSQTFTYAGVNPAPQGLASGVFVRVTVETARDASGRWVVTALSAGVPVRDGLDNGEVNGLITEFVSNGNFRVNGLPVDASIARIEGGPLAVGLRVRVEGSIQAGVVLARKVEVEDEDGGGAFELRGTLASVDKAAHTFTLAGRSEIVSFARPDVTFENGSADDLVPGQRVKVNGVLSADHTRIDATRIEFDD